MHYSVISFLFKRNKYIINKVNYYEINYRKIGYIDQKQFNLDTVVNSIVEFMTSPDIHWDTNYEVNGKPNVKDLEGFLYHTFTFDLDNPKLGFIKVILVNIDTDKVNTSYKFQGFIDGEDDAFYSPVDSTVDKKKIIVGIFI